ncbi:hypothetical protein ABIB08_005916 [Bradyrhizobium sp. RT11b]
MVARETLPEACAQLPPHPSLRAQRSNPDFLRGGSLDCFVARAPRNDGVREQRRAKISHRNLAQRSHLRRLQPPSRLAMMPSGIFGAGHDGSNGGLRGRGEIDDGACGVGKRARHRDRVVRFPDLRHGSCAGLQQAVLSELRSLRRNAGGVLDLCGRLRGASDRRRDHRALRRPARPQDHAGRDHDRDGARHLPDRLPADLQPDRRLGADPAHHPALRPGHWARGRMERRGRDGDRARR